jgi:hypothetical protein
MGDFNLDLAQLQRLSSEWPGIFQITKADGDLATVRRNGGRTIDYICVRQPGYDTGFAEALPCSKVLQDWDISDHYPVINKLPSMACRPHRTPAPTIAQTPASKRIRVPEKEMLESISSNNRWAALAEYAASADEALDRDAALAQLNIQASRLKTTCHEIAAELELHNSPRQSGPSVVPTKLHRSINTRRKAWRKVLAMLKDPLAHDVEIDETEEQYSRCKKRTRSLVSKFRRKLWHKRVAKAHANLLHNPKQFWKWASYTAKWNLKSAAGGVQPIMNADGVLVVTLPEILEAWRSHFKRLATDITGNSLDPEKWRPIADDTTLDPLPDLDGAMTKEDLWYCVQRMKQHSAPGDDGIPSDFYRAVAEDRRAHDEWLEFCAMDQGEPPPQPPIPMTKALLSVIRQQWAPA